MSRFARPPLIVPELLLGSELPPPPSGPVRLSLSDRPERERPTLLRECFARIGFRYEMDPLRDAPFEADLSLNMLPDVMIMAGTLHGSRNRRTRPLVEGDADDAVLLVNLRGPHLIEQFGKELVLGDGEAVLVSSADPSSFTHRPPGEVLGLRVPKTRLTPLLLGAERRYMQRIPRGAPGLSLLTNYVALTWDEQVTASSEMKHLMANHICDLMAVMLGATLDAGEAARGSGVRAARLHAVKQDIAKSLSQPNLSVAALADRHGCTPRSLQRLFEADGTTFTQHLLAQRLSHAHQLLTDPCHDGEKISAVALACGFGDLSYFNRMFRQRYGAAPSDVRAEARRVGASRIVPT
jgi:AraC-like DNA-binding protein